MDALFSNSQETEINNLLKNQQISQDTINQLLKQTESLMCGPTCQKLKISEELKQKYIAAETNMKTAPIQLEQTKKNYYVYTEGKTYYNNMLEEELKKKATLMVSMLSENFNNEITNATTMNAYLNTALTNVDYMKELLQEYIEKNRLLQLKLKDSHSDILTNDRKTYYQFQEIDRLKLWHKIWISIYYIIAITFVICCAVAPSQLSLSKKIILSVLVVFYPYYIDLIVRAIYNFLMGIYKNTPKNVYNNL